jgi:hypothetical protein
MAILSIGELALRVSLKRGPQVGTCALGENPGIPRTRGLMGESYITRRNKASTKTYKLLK